MLVLVRAAQWPVRAASRPIIRRIRREPDLIAFGSGTGRFADNSAHLFLHMVGEPGLRCVWISPSASTVERLRALGLPAERRWSRDGVRVAVRASWYVFSSYRSDINLWLSDGATAFNLWHGVGVKRVQRDRPTGDGSSVHSSPEGSVMARIFADDRRSPDWQLTTSPMLTETLSRAFDVPVERCVALGYPRNDGLFDTGAAAEALVDRSLFDAIAGRGRVVGYFPTFRDGSVSVPGGAPTIDEMAAIVRAQGGILVFKAHDATRAPDVDRETTVVLPREADLNTYLGLCDILITDYSSVATDFLLLDRPVVLYCPDLDEYADGRGFIRDPAEVLPGTLVRTKDELYRVLEHLEAIPVAENQEELKALWWGDTARPGARQRVCDFIVAHLHRH